MLEEEKQLEGHHWNWQFLVTSRLVISERSNGLCNKWKGKKNITAISDNIA